MSDVVNVIDSIQKFDMPSRKAILQYLVRMGSITSLPRFENADSGDLDVFVDTFFHRRQTWDSVKYYCERTLQLLLQPEPEPEPQPQPRPRFQDIDFPMPINFYNEDNIPIDDDEAEEDDEVEDEDDSEDEQPIILARRFVDVEPRSGNSIRIMQWNILAQTLAVNSDKFAQCPPSALDWNLRRWRLLLEMATSQPDIICLQEVDHYGFFETVFSCIGYKGFFAPKPDSPCIHFEDNNGPDGCAIFINKDSFDILDTKTKILDIWHIESNHVALFCKLSRRSDGKTFWIGTTHLKAHHGGLYDLLRIAQGDDLRGLIRSLDYYGGPVLLTGDFNASPSEDIYYAFRLANFVSVNLNHIPTTWVNRSDVEYETHDYILYRDHTFRVERFLRFPTGEEIGQNGLPTDLYPSHHFALVADLVFEES